jgi:hypothetical protein
MQILVSFFYWARRLVLFMSLWAVGVALGVMLVSGMVFSTTLPFVT